MTETQEISINKKWITRARSRVIQNFIEVEALLHEIIAIHYFGELTKEEKAFIVQVLQDEQCNFGLRRNMFTWVLYKFFDRNSNMKSQFNDLICDLRTLNTTQNLFAHVHPVTIEKNGERRLVIPYTNPEKSFRAREKKEEINLKQKHKEFLEKQRLVARKLKTFKKLLVKDIKARRPLPHDAVLNFFLRLKMGSKQALRTLEKVRKAIDAGKLA
ncbi:MAG: hypothetical protein AABZ51_02445 [Nitrospirota bacterium]|jgi:hypothetical protein